LAETKDFIDKLMNKKDTELDDLLSFADNVKYSNNKESKNADDILDELAEKKEQVYHTKKLICHEIKNNSFTQPVVINFHHLLATSPLQDYISYESICGNNTVKKAILEDEAQPKKENTLPLKIDETSEPEEDSLPPPAASESFDAFEFADGVSNAEKFITEQGVKHPKIYFAIGISIFFLTLLGLASCIYLGITALKHFAQNYSETTVTPAAEIKTLSNFKKI